MSDARRDTRVAGFHAGLIRLFDIVLASIGLLVTAPLFPIIGVFIKLDSEGPVFYPAERVGKGMTLFPMYKFRTMLDCATAINQSICAQYDPRVTTAGRILRRTKLNELPQLLNILKGDMSFVGPRPEAPNLAERYPQEAKVDLLGQARACRAGCDISLREGSSGGTRRSCILRGSTRSNITSIISCPKKSRSTCSICRGRRWPSISGSSSPPPRRQFSAS